MHLLLFLIEWHSLKDIWKDQLQLKKSQVFLRKRIFMKNLLVFIIYFFKFYFFLNTFFVMIIILYTNRLINLSHYFKSFYWPFDVRLDEFCYPQIVFYCLLIFHGVCFVCSNLITYIFLFYFYFKKMKMFSLKIENVIISLKQIYWNMYQYN